MMTEVSTAFDYASQGRVAQLARTYWLPSSDSTGQFKKPFNPDLIERIYLEDLISFGFSHRRCMTLELSQYLEAYLWPNFNKSSSRAHVISICAMVNEKARERVPIWQCFLDLPSNFDVLIDRILRILLDEPLQLQTQTSGVAINNEVLKKRLAEHIVLITFLSHCFTNLAEVGVLRRSLKDMYCLAVWRHLQPARLEKELDAVPRYRKLLHKLEKRAAIVADPEEADRLATERSFIARFIDRFLRIIEQHPTDAGEIDPLLAHYLQRCLLLLIDLSSMLLTRRFLIVLIDDRHTVIRCQSCSLYKENKEGCLFSELVDVFAFYALFQVDKTTGEAVDAIELDRRHCAQLNQLRLEVFSLKREDFYRDFAVSNPAACETKEKLGEFFHKLSVEELRDLAARFAFLPPKEEEASEPASKRKKPNDASVIANQPTFPDYIFEKEMLVKILVFHFVRRESHLAEMNNAPLYPTEDLLWNENLVPTEFCSGEECLALPKLGLQFLTLQDYLVRNFTLFRLESTFEVRQDLEDAITRMKPWSGEQNQVVFDGWSRMALPIQAFNIIEVGKPALGAKHPSRVRADVRVVLAGLRPGVQKEWRDLRRHDPVFLVTVRPKSHQRHWKYNPRKPFLSQIGIVAVRGCEIEGQVDKAGKLIPDEERFGIVPAKNEFDAATTSPTWRVALDACQYQADIDRLRRQRSRGKQIRAEIARAKREGRSGEAIEALEKAAAEADSVPLEDVYDTFNVIVRRKPKENNFKAVLDTIRDLMNTRSVVPDWLLDLLMGYQDPAAAHYSRRPDVYETKQNWFDTFISSDHIISAFPQYRLLFSDSRSDRSNNDQTADSATIKPPPPYRLTFPPLTEDRTTHVECCMPMEQLLPTACKPVEPNGKAEPMEVTTKDETTSKPALLVEAYTPVGSHVPWHLLTIDCPTWLPGSRPGETKPGNRIHFTPRQVEAIRAGMQAGLTMVVGPPGTGKTDIAVQTIHNLYHNYPGERILVVTHSNQALNQLFEKIIALDIDERHLLRLGHGEEALATTKDFSRYGRVDYILSRRLELLQKVSLLRKSIEAEIPVTSGEATDQTDDKESAPTAVNTKRLESTGGRMDTCETAQYFFLQDVLPRWENFTAGAAKALQQDDDAEQGERNLFVQRNFPFTPFITGLQKPPDDVVQQIFPGKSLTQDLSAARSCFRAISCIFTNLEEFRAFELMRTGLERANFLLTQESKIVAMTCTHAALKRRDLVQLGFTYDTIIMEEAAQILEIETFIPLLLQNPDISGRNRLKRWIMIGDHNQLPPVVKNQAFSNFSNMSQSLFTRLVKLGVPTVQLDAQGRTRPSISQLYSWRYNSLTDIPHVITSQEYKLCNPGFQYEFQLVNVEDYKGIGESEPSPYFYQNLAEAEYVVATYMYMRILGYPAERISILTTYNGQKHLIRDVIEARCASNPLLGKPQCVTTVDRFQGQQNDYVLISLVRTLAVGHLRDVRRLVVALSRARLGMYIFARVEQFATCQELRPAFDRLLGRLGSSGPRPTALHLTPWENWQDPRAPSSLTLRPVHQLPDRPAYVPADMPEMANYVSKMYEERVKTLISLYTARSQKAKSRIPASISSAPIEPKALEKLADEKQREEEVAYQVSAPEVTVSPLPSPGASKDAELVEDLDLEQDRMDATDNVDDSAVPNESTE
uniref:Intron-binding protein aquarius n=1 Tax=Schistocephalus solidus TaxID=70667 RepID=A0A0X3QDM8_SCHSO